MTDTPKHPEQPEQTPGNGIVLASWLGTVALAATTALGSAVRQTDIAALVVSLAMFVGGIGAFGAAFARAVGRSRTDEIGIMNLFFLDHSAPAPVRRSLLGSLAVEVLTALAGAALHPNTSLAFGILAPVYGVAMAGLWGARHGVFPSRTDKPKKPRR
jgi:hypothetical protein